MELRQVAKFLQALVLVLVGDSFSRAERSRRNSPRLPCTSQGVEWVRSPESCSMYVVCSFGLPMATMHCPNSLLWSVQVKNCVPRGSRWDDCSGTIHDKALSRVDTGNRERTRQHSATAAPSWNHRTSSTTTTASSWKTDGTRWVNEDNRGWGSESNGETNWNDNTNSAKEQAVSNWNSEVKNGNSRTVSNQNRENSNKNNQVVSNWNSENNNDNNRAVSKWNSDDNNKEISVSDHGNSANNKGKDGTELNWRSGDSYGERSRLVTEWNRADYSDKSTKNTDWSNDRRPEIGGNNDRRATETSWNSNRRRTGTDWNNDRSRTETDWSQDRGRTETDWNSERSRTETDWKNARSRTDTDWNNAKGKQETDWNSDRSVTETGWGKDGRQPAAVRNNERVKAISNWDAGRGTRQTDWNRGRLAGTTAPSTRSVRNRKVARRTTKRWKDYPTVRMRGWKSYNKQKLVGNWGHTGTEGQSNLVFGRGKARKERQSEPSDWGNGGGNSQSWRGGREEGSRWGYTNTPQTTTFLPITRRTSPIPRWRWQRYDYTRPPMEVYPDNYGDNDGDDYNYSTEAGGYPGRNEEFPTYTGRYPTFKDRYPSNTNNYPSPKDKYPSSTNNFPTESDKYPTNGNGDKYPSGDYPIYDAYEDYDSGEKDYPQATARWLRTTPARELAQSTTTFKSPFARFDTTRRRPVVVNDGLGEGQQGSSRPWPRYRTVAVSNENDSGDEKAIDDWVKKSPWWKPWSTHTPSPTPTPTPNPASVPSSSDDTPRPWWAPDVLPWLTPSSNWVPDTQAVPSATQPMSTGAPLTTPPPTSTPPPTTTPSPTTTTTPSPPPTTTEWYTEATTSLTPTIISWSPQDNDYDYDNDNDVGRTTTAGGMVDEDYDWQNSNATPAYHPECGVAVTNMIVGGLPASKGRWPWVVSLRLTWARRHVCGGTLVHPQWIVTAAHCVFGSQFEEATDWRAVFGNVQPTLTSDVKDQLKIDLIVRHPEFVNGGNYPNDIAMMRLEKPVDVTGFRIRHACLPSRDKPFLSNSFEEQSVLQELEVKIRRNQACAARWGWKRILNSHVCVGNGDGGACNGDSGGPLVCLRDGYYYLAGVTSWGVSGCQTTGYPSVFSRVSFYQKWIEGVIQTYSTIDFPLRK